MPHKKTDDMLLTTIIVIVGVGVCFVMMSMIGVQWANTIGQAGANPAGVLALVICTDVGVAILLLVLVRSAIKLRKKPAKEKALDG